ncbi:phage portal protein [Mycobacteroides chelonae]|uniref:phage portal protein n=1 Tax=Mycobacteroides chelonae TaxID=1774 RepID=UPI0008AA31F8|nr:phage portal protein [Mycobacteroides chelonae]OHU37307.1 phage portal protein [Mycobacteroides chelonae]
MAFVVSEGSVRGMSRPSVTPIRSIELSPWVAMDYFELWRKQPSVRRTVSFLARNIAQLGIHTFERRGDNDRKRLTDHALARLLQQPNSFTTRYRFLNTLVHDFAIYDCAYWWKIKTGDGPRLVHLPAPLITPKGDNWLTPEQFEFRGTKSARLIPADEVVYFRGYGGIADAGVSPLESLRQILREDWTASEMRDQIMRNGARHSGYISRPKVPDAPKWSEDAKARFKREWQSEYAGAMAANAGGTPLLEDGMTFVAASQTAKDLQYIESRKLTDEEVARSYFIPPPMIGILDHATFSNIEEQHQMLYQDTLGPWLTMIQDEIVLQLLPDFESKPEKFYVEFNLMEKLSGNVEKRDASITQSVGGPWRTINEGRSLANLPPVENGDELIRPLNVTQNGDQEPIPADDGSAPTMTPTEKPPADETEQED